MRSWFVLVLAIIGLAVIEIIHPGVAWYRSDWCNVGVAFFALLVIIGVRRFPVRPMVGIAMLTATVLCAVAVIGNGLFAPSPRTIAGAPGADVAISDFGATAHFPLIDAQSPTVGISGIGPVARFGSTSVAATATIEEHLRRVVFVSASDARHGHLTVTQPTSQTFLSPILLMKFTHTIDGMNAPFDGFTLPAVHRNVKVILFSPAQAATLPFESRGGSGIFFIVTDDLGHTVPHGIVLARDGQAVTVAGLTLQGRVVAFPDLTIAATPFIPAVLLGVLAFLWGCGVAWRSR